MYSCIIEKSICIKQYSKGKEAINLRRSKRGMEERKEKGDVMHLDINLKI